MSVDQHGNDDPFIGQVLDGKYRIDTMIGRGGMGAVYRATHILMDHPCAVKVLHSTMLADPSAIPRFQREARAAARIRHQNAISVNDFGITSDNVVYLVMEFFPGSSLREVLREEGLLAPERVAKIIERVAAALDAAHQQGIIHRDVKPDNIMLRKLPSGEDEVKVLDFGIAKIVDQPSNSENLTITGTIIGTPHYLSPEQCRAASDLDARSDLYSLGVVTYEMLTGSVPFMAATPIAVAMMHISDPPPPMDDKVEDMPAGVEEVVGKSLAKKREDRWQSTVEFAQELYKAVFGSYATGTGALPIPEGASGSLRAPAGLSTDTPRPATVSTDSSQVASNTQPNGVETKIFDSDAEGTSTPAPRAGSDPLTGQITARGTPVVSSSSPTPTPSPGTMATGAVGPAPPVDEQQEPSTRIMRPPAEAAPRTGHRYIYISAVGLALLAGILGTIYFLAPEGTTPAENQSVGNVRNAQTTPRTDTPAKPPQGMVYIPGGTFMMGRESEDIYVGPPHEVEVQPYFMDITEVTNKQYAEFVKATGYAPPPDWTNGTYTPGTADLPVVNVMWQDARAYAEWAGKRLPTEAEWEYAARGTDGRLYPWGDEWVPGSAYTKESKLTKLQPVGSAPQGASPFGVLDMAGNVWEWCEDNFSPYPGSTAEPKDQSFKIIRGGSLGDDQTKATTTYRNWVPPERQFEALGFRCVKSLK